MMTFKMSGLDALKKKAAAMTAAMQRASKIALLSTGKMVRETAKDMARGRGAYGFESNPLGWHKLSPFSGTIDAAKGARRSGFIWAKKTVSESGWESAQALVDKSIYSRRLTREMRRQIRLARGQKISKVKKKLSMLEQPMARLRGFVRSRLDEVSKIITIGFYRNSGDGSTDSRIEDLVKKQAVRSTTIVTPKMRRFFFGIGFPTSQASLTLRPRPWFIPVFEKVKSLIPAHFKQKFDEIYSGLKD